jgi:tetratricopeptide (TPR) repeat protein
MVSQWRGDLDRAESWFKKALLIREELNNRPRIAKCYHQLGMIAQMRGDFGGAESWYQNALEINKTLGNLQGMASSFGQLGQLAEERGVLTEALHWVVHCISLFKDIPHAATEPGRKILKRLVDELGEEALEQCWRSVTGKAVPEEVWRFISVNE